MKKASKISTLRFIIELFVTIVVAYLLALVFNLILLMIVGMFASIELTNSTVGTISYVVMGVLVGYKLNSLIAQYRVGRAK